MYIYLNILNQQGSTSAFVQIFLSLHEHNYYLLLTLLFSMNESVGIKKKKKKVNFEKLFSKVH